MARQCFLLFSSECAIFPSILSPFLRACTIFAVTSGVALAGGLRVSGVLAHTAPVEGDGLSTTLMKWLYLLQTNVNILHLLYSSTASSSSRLPSTPTSSALLQSTLSLDALQHWPLPLLSFGHVSSSVSSARSRNASECVDRGFGVIVPGFCVHGRFTFVIKFEGLFFMSFFVLFLFESKDVYCTVLYWPVS